MLFCDINVYALGTIRRLFIPEQGMLINRPNKSNKCPPTHVPLTPPALAFSPSRNIYDDNHVWVYGFYRVCGFVLWEFPSENIEGYIGYPVYK